MPSTIGAVNRKNASILANDSLSCKVSQHKIELKQINAQKQNVFSCFLNGDHEPLYVAKVSLPSIDMACDIESEYFCFRGFATIVSTGKPCFSATELDDWREEFFSNITNSLTFNGQGAKLDKASTLIAPMGFCVKNITGDNWDTRLSELDPIFISYIEDLLLQVSMTHLMGFSLMDIKLDNMVVFKHSQLLSQDTDNHSDPSYCILIDNDLNRAGRAGSEYGVSTDNLPDSYQDIIRMDKAARKLFTVQNYKDKSHPVHQVLKHEIMDAPISLLICDPMCFDIYNNRLVLTITRNDIWCLAKAILGLMGFSNSPDYISHAGAILTLYITYFIRNQYDIPLAIRMSYKKLCALTTELYFFALLSVRSKKKHFDRSTAKSLLAQSKEFCDSINEILEIHINSSQMEILQKHINEFRVHSKKLYSSISVKKSSYLVTAKSCIDAKSAVFAEFIIRFCFLSECSSRPSVIQIYHQFICLQMTTEKPYHDLRAKLYSIAHKQIKRDPSSCSWSSTSVIM